jgi:hypothetical protein
VKRIALALSLVTVLFAINVAGCCFGEPEEGQFCFIIIPIPLPGADGGDAGTDFTVERVDCDLVR